MVFALSAVFCLGSSAFFHLFYIKNEHWYETLARLDYGGISILIMGSSYPPIFYGFACKEVFLERNIFLALITTTSTACFVATMNPAFNKPHLRGARSLMYIILGLSAAFPLVRLRFLT